MQIQEYMNFQWFYKIQIVEVQKICALLVRKFRT
jgi:hypothetical protein